MITTNRSPRAPGSSAFTTRYRRTLVALGLIALLSSTGAQACEFWRDSNGFPRSNCKFQALSKEKYKLVIDVIEGRPRYTLPLPNLTPHKIKMISFGGPQADVNVEVRNDGSKDSPTTDVAVTVQVIDPSTNTQVGATQFFTAPIPAVTVGTTPRFYIATATLPNRNQDWDLIINAVVDPPTATSTTGRFYEGNEMDNALSRTCRYYGPNPNLVGPEACD